MWHVVRVHRRNIVGPRFDDCKTIEMLALKFDQFQTSSNNFQQVATTCNNTHTFGVQTLATSWAQLCCAWSANNVASVCTGLQKSRQGWNACIVFMGVMLLSTCYNKHICMQISVCLLQMLLKSFSLVKCPFSYTPLGKRQALSEEIV